MISWFRGPSLPRLPVAALAPARLLPGGHHGGQRGPPQRQEHRPHRRQVDPQALPGAAPKGTLGDALPTLLTGRAGSLASVMLGRGSFCFRTGRVRGLMVATLGDENHPSTRGGVAGGSEVVD